MAQWRTAAGTLATPSNWSSAATWQYWNGSAWTAAPNGAQNYPGTADDVLFHGSFRVMLDIDAEINTITNITTGFNGTHTALTSTSGLVYNTTRTLICRGTTSVAGVVNTNIIATTESLIYPALNNSTLTLGSSTYPAFVKGLSTATSSRGTLSMFDAAASVNYTGTINIIGTGANAGLFGGTAGNGIWIGNGSTLTLNLDGNFAANGGSAVALNTSGSLILNINGTIQPAGTIPPINVTTGSGITINTKTGGTTNILGSSGTASLVNTGSNIGAFVLNLSVGSTITAGAGTGTNGAAINLLTPASASVILTGVNVTASSSSFALNAGSGVNTYTYTNFSLLKDSATNTPCIITNSTSRNAIVSPVLNSDSSTIFKIKTTSGVNNDFQVSTGGTIPNASDVRYLVPVGSTTGTLVVPPASTVLLGTPVDATTGTLDIGASVWNYATTSATTAGSLGLLLGTNLDTTVGSRLASVSYTAPDNATIATINTNTTDIPNLVAQVIGNIVANLT